MDRLALICIAALLAWPKPSPAGRVLHHINELLALSEEAAARGLPTDITATVTLYEPGLYQFFVQEGDAGLYVWVSATSSWKLKAGDLIRIEGKSQQGGYAPVLAPDRIRWLGHTGLPVPVRPATFSVARDTDQFDNRFAELQGRVLSATPLYLDGGEEVYSAHKLKLEHQGQTIDVMLHVPKGHDLSWLIQSEVTVRGILTASRMQHKQRHDAWLAVSSLDDVHLIRRQPLNWDEWPQVALGRLLQYQGTRAPESYFRTEGTVSWFDGVNTAIIEDGAGMMSASRAWPQSLQVGTRYEVLGRLVLGDRGYFQITEAQFRELGPGRINPPRAALARELGYGEADGELVKLAAVMPELADYHAICVLQLEEAELSWEAVLPHAFGACPTWIPRGSLVEVTGRVQNRWMEGRRFPVQSTILLRSPSDVRVLSSPPWWRHLPLGKFLAAAAVFATVALAWIWQLRRRVRIQTARIQEQNAQLEKEKVKAEQASRLKSEFLANMSHEIRTPMNGVLGMTEILLDSELSCGQRADLLTVRSSAESLLTVLNDILDFSKIEAGKLTLDPITFNLPDNVEQSLKVVALTARQKKIEFACDIAPDVPQEVIGDPTRLRQILLNLAGNAVKFTDRGEVCVRVAVQSSDPDSVLLHFEVRDTGSGIPLEKQQAIFDPFTQADASTTRKHGGTGLGLTISARLLEMMGGRIWVESEAGQGSRFQFVALFGKVPAKDNSLQHAPAPTTRLSLADPARNLRILVAEDNPVNQELVRRLLEKQNHTVVMVNNGREAIAAVEQDLFDLVLMDVQMPELDGLEATASIRSLEEKTGRHQRIVAMTAHAMSGDRERCLAAGMDGYVSKPVRSTELMEVTCAIRADQTDFEKARPDTPKVVG